ncbi:MAG: histidine phosphatase family protein [Pseudomonadota bacterium]
MKTLLLLRHAKSSWEDDLQADFDRPLNDRGYLAAPRMGAYLRLAKLAPDLILCSTARRTRETLDGVIDGLGQTPDAWLLNSLYLASPDQMLSEIAKVVPGTQSVMLIAHNPGLEALALSLIDPAIAPPRENQLLQEKYPTAALTVITFDTTNWNLPLGKGALRKFVRPKDLETD